MSTLANSYTGAGMAQAFSRGMSPERFAERSEAYARKEESDQRLDILRATKPTEQDMKNQANAQSLEIQNALETQKQMLRNNNRQTTFSAYERYDADGDVRHINTMLNDLQSNGSTLYNKIARVDPLTEDDRPLLEEMGIPKNLQDAILQNPELNRSYLRVTQKDGTVIFGELDTLKGVTGYNDYAGTKELERQKVARELEIIASLGYEPSKNSLEAFHAAKAEIGMDADPKSPEFREAYLKHLKETRKSSRNTGLRGGRGTQTNEEGYAERALEAEGIYEGDPDYSRRYNELVREYKNLNDPAAIKNITAAETAATELEEEGFWEMDLNNLNPSERGRIESKVRRIEQLSGAELSVADRDTLARIQRLTSLGKKGSELTDEQTGIIDNVLRTVKKYVSDDVEGVDATSAYSAFRNLVQHALYGAALTPHEAKNFSRQLGSLSQQKGPILAQFRTSLQELQDAYQAIERTNHPMVMAWRTGKTETELRDVINGLDDRIEYIDNLQKGIVTPYTTVNPPVQPSNNKVEMTPEREAELERILFGDG